MVFFDLFINIFEGLCLFFIISLITWKINKKEVLESPYFKMIYVISMVVFIFINNTSQIICELILPSEYNKIIAFIIFIVLNSILFGVLYNNIKKIYFYLLAIIFSFSVICISETIVLGIPLLFGYNLDIILNNPTNYIIACILAILVKYIFLIVLICIIEPQFFKKLIKKEKDKGMSLLASTVTIVASTKASFPSWLWFHQPKTPKSLIKKNK